MFNIFPGKNAKHVTLIAVGTSLQSGPYESGRTLRAHEGLREWRRVQTLWEPMRFDKSAVSVWGQMRARIDKFKLYGNAWESMRVRESLRSNESEIGREAKLSELKHMKDDDSAREFEAKREGEWTRVQTLKSKSAWVSGQTTAIVLTHYNVSRFILSKSAWE